MVTIFSTSLGFSDLCSPKPNQPRSVKRFEIILAVPSKSVVYLDNLVSIPKSLKKASVFSIAA